MKMNNEQTKQHLAKWEQVNSFQLPTSFIEKAKVYEQLLYDWNKVHNFTRIAQADFATKHLLDSLMLLSNYPSLVSAKKALDAGTGPGIPGLILALALPEVSWTLVDSQQKRIAFLEVVTSQLELNNVSCIQARVEHLSKLQEYTGHFQVVTARALTALDNLYGTIHSLLAPAGVLLALKGCDIGMELNNLQNKYKNTLNIQVKPYSLPNGSVGGNVVIIGR